MNCSKCIVSKCLHEFSSTFAVATNGLQFLYLFVLVDGTLATQIDNELFSKLIENDMSIDQSNDERIMALAIMPCVVSSHIKLRWALITGRIIFPADQTIYTQGRSLHAGSTFSSAKRFVVGALRITGTDMARHTQWTK